jgi:hypothetical protein
MKQLINIVFLLLVFLSSKTYSQTYNFETTDMSMSVKVDKKRWSEFANPKEAKISVIFDSNRDRITIFSEIPQFLKKNKLQKIET